MGFAFLNYDLEVMFAISLVFLAIPWTALALRIYVRGFMMKNWGLDDTLMVFAMLCFTVESGVVAEIGPSLVNMTVKQINFQLLMCLISSSFYLACSVFFKLSLGVFFRRFLQEPWQRHTILVCMIIYTLVGIGFIVLLNVQCGNPANLLSSQLSKHCGKWAILRPLNYFYACINTITDWIFSLIPILTIRTLNMPRRDKIVASVLLGLGAAASISSMVRMKYIEGLNVNVQLFPSPAIGTTSCIEMGLGMTAASCATLRPLFKGLVARVKTTIRGSRFTTQVTEAQSGIESWRRIVEASKKGPLGMGTEGTFMGGDMDKGITLEFVEEFQEGRAVSQHGGENSPGHWTRISQLA